jgi:ribosomal-protein-alanine N-acetyltransferase
MSGFHPLVQFAIMTNMTELTTCALRLATKTDARAIARMSQKYIEEGLEWRWRPESIERQIRNSDTVVLIAEIRLGERCFLGGFAIMNFDMDAATLSLLAVHPKLRRKGVANRLLRWLHKSAMTAGCHKVSLQVRAANHEARAFYRKLGYRESSYLPRYYDGKEAAYQMETQFTNQ